MAEFSTSAMLELEVDQRSLSDARDEIESEVGVVSVETDTGGFGGKASGMADGGTTNLSDTAGSQSLQTAQLEKLNDIHEELEKIGVSGGLGGGGGGGGGGLPTLGAGAIVGKVFGKGTLLTAGGVVAALGIDQVGKQFGDMTSDEWANMIFGAAGGLVPSGFWDQQAGDGIAITDATIAAGSVAIEGVEDLLSGDGGEWPTEHFDKRRGSRPEDQRTREDDWERQSNPNQPNRDTGQRDRMTEERIIQEVLSQLEISSEQNFDIQNRYQIDISNLDEVEDKVIGETRHMVRSELRDEIKRRLGTYRSDTRQGPV